MKILQTEIALGLNTHISLQERDEPFFKAPFHFHPELELVYVKKSTGKRIIGDKIESFEDGDMVFVGRNLPHVWLSDEAYYQETPGFRASSVVLYFNADVLGPLFYNMEEAGVIRDFFKMAERGIQITGKTRDNVASQLKKLATQKGLKKIIGLFEIFNSLSNSKEIRYIASEGYKPGLERSETDRLSKIFKYVQENFKNDISLATVSNLAGLTPQSFCRMFKQKTNKHFVEYLNEVRISKACSLLLSTESPIADIAYQCGFKTISNFNKLFKEIAKTSPSGYRGLFVVSDQHSGKSIKQVY
ncbi:MAG: AraC family transcriptional regulator [Ginsengibacter sp.]